MTFAEVTKATELLGYAPDTPLDVGLKAFVDWLNKYDPV
jgi:nucleoside-diphosphate-sugar epimerase